MEDAKYVIGEAAMQAGFRNYTAFYRAYKTEFGTSPRMDLGKNIKEMGYEN